MTSMCYQPNDASCGDRFPVICDSQATTIAPVMKETTPPDSGQTSTVEPTPDISTEPTSSVPSPPQSTGPSGEYCGSVDSTVKLGIRLGFDGQTASLTLSEFIKGTISGLLYTYNESTKLVQIQPTLEYQNFLAALPLVLVPEDVVVTYDPSADRVSGTVLGISIPATKDAC
jgi:hypothetical protein